MNPITQLRIKLGRLKWLKHAYFETKRIKEEVSKLDKTKGIVYYLGITEHNNLGDNAQHYCIKNWIAKNLPNYQMVMVDATTIIMLKAGWLSWFKKTFRQGNDLIVFQSGYCTQDLGGTHELMHRLIADNLPDAKILMMPQTIFFQNEKNRERTSKSYNKCPNMLFLARDEVSYKQALDMFPDLQVKLYPDIVTTLIGKFTFNNKRNKIFLCRRDDGEKFYPESELIQLKEKLESLAPVEVGDTQYEGDNLRQHLQEAIHEVIAKMSTYKCVVTDRYHGTIFALCANTPVIIIKSNDHKVVTGANWFKGIYDDRVYVAEDLEDAYKKAEEICRSFDYSPLSPYFEKEYYDKLTLLFNH